MDANPVILAIPMFFILMAIEFFYERYTNQKTYRLNDAVTNINTGILQQLSNVFIAVFKIAAYTFIYEQFSFTQLPQNTITFVLALVLWDLCYYWEHRMAHTVNLFWGGHIVHHQSEEYNLSVALRQTSTGFIWGIPFYLPMALMGFHPIQFLLVGGLNLLYQFWIHTEHIKKLPAFLEYFLNTPSHHRVHHGRDPKYIDKNYGGIFIIWDRIFQTFQKEEFKPHYGITTPLRSWNPIWANLIHYKNLWQWLTKTRSIGDGVKLLFNKPGWFPDYMGGTHSVKEVEPTYKKYDVQNKKRNVYIFTQFLIFLGLSAFFFFKYSAFDQNYKVAFALWIASSTMIFSLLFETNQKWVFTLEGLRALSIPALLYFGVSYL